MDNKKLYDKIIAEIAFMVETGGGKSEENRISLIKNFFERGLILGAEEGYRKAERKFNAQNMYLDEEVIDE